MAVRTNRHNGNQTKHGGVMVSKNLESRIKQLETEVLRLRKRNGELFVALQESAPHRIQMSGVSAGSIVKEGCK